MENKKKIPTWLKVVLKLGISYFALAFSMVISLYIVALGNAIHMSPTMQYIGVFLVPALLIPFIWIHQRKTVLKIWGIVFVVYLVFFGIDLGINLYNQSITVDTSPNIVLEEYLPFTEDSKIAELDYEASLKLEGDLPIIDGAAALFPVYSAFVNETYPNTVELFDGTFEYNNTVAGYDLLAQKETDIFIGVYPSQEQIDVAKKLNTEFVYTPIGSEAFVFFVHKDNPIDSLTTEQIQGIYSGKIKNWKEVGGNDEKIVAFQRNEGSGSQSMLIRFMDGKELMKAPSEQVNDLMSGIIEQVSDYRSTTASIGFSYRYYVEGIIKNPDIKIIKVDGVVPTQETIKTNKYPIVTPIYAVTYQGNENKNVDLLLQWILSKEGQEIIEKTGYAGL